MTKTLLNIANPHIRIYREIGNQVLASIDDGWTHTHTQTDVIELYIRLQNLGFSKRKETDWLSLHIYIYIITLVWGLQFSGINNAASLTNGR